MTNGRLTCRRPTSDGRTEEVRTKAALTETSWVILETLAGDRTVRTVTIEPTGVAGFLRALENPG